MVVQIPQCSEYTDAGAVASDNFDDDLELTAAITTGGDFPLDTTVLGVFTIVFDVADSAGNQAETKSRIVEVCETRPLLGGLK